MGEITTIDLTPILITLNLRNINIILGTKYTSISEAHKNIIENDRQLVRFLNSLLTEYSYLLNRDQIETFKGIITDILTISYTDSESCKTCGTEFQNVIVPCGHYMCGCKFPNLCPVCNHEIYTIISMY